MAKAKIKAGLKIRDNDPRVGREDYSSTRSSMEHFISNLYLRTEPYRESRRPRRYEPGEIYVRPGPLGGGVIVEVATFFGTLTLDDGSEVYDP